MATATTDLQRIGATVRDLRVKRGWRQRELAEAAKVSDRTIQALESGRERARDSTYGRIARALEIPLDQLLGEDDAGD